MPRRLADPLATPKSRVHRPIWDTRAGDQTGTNDRDVLIVIEYDKPGNPIEQIQRFYPYFDPPLGSDLVVTWERWG